MRRPLGAFEDGKEYVGRIQTPRLFVSLGSVLCNDPWLEALNHLKYWVGAMRPGDLLIGIDGHLLPSDEGQNLGRLPLPRRSV